MRVVGTFMTFNVD